MCYCSFKRSLEETHIGYDVNVENSILTCGVSFISTAYNLLLIVALEEH